MIRSRISSCWSHGYCVSVLWLVLLLVGAFGASADDPDDKQCPELSKKLKCACTKDTVWCENKGITALPQAKYFPSGVKKLYLKGNRLTKINFSNKRFEHLEVLDLSSNELGQSSGIADTVKQLKELKELYLQNNKINKINTSYLTGTKVKIVNVSNNPVNEFDYPDDENPSLQKLLLADLRFSNIPIQLFKIYPQLLVIDISGNDISDLDVNAFSNNTNLKEIYLNNNKLETLPEKIFANLGSLQKLYLGNNPWNCTCTLEWLRSMMNDNAKKDIFKDSSQTNCIQFPGIALKDVAKEKFTSSGCHKLAKRAIEPPETILFEPKTTTVTAKPTVFSGESSVVTNVRASGKFGPASCIMEQKTSLLVIYTVPSKSPGSSCQQQCFNNGHAYFNLIGSPSQCLCGDVDVNCSCTVCQSMYHLEPGAQNILSGLKVSYATPVTIGSPTTITVQWNISTDSITFDVNDGSKAIETSDTKALHTFMYPGTFDIKITLCSVKGKCRIVHTDIVVSSLEDAGQMSCPTDNYVKLGEKVSLRATFTHAYNSEILWSRTVNGGSTPVTVPCKDGEKFSGNGHCFQVVQEKKSWTDASDHCSNSHGGTLAIVGSDEVSKFLQNLMTRNTSTMSWIGLKKSDILDDYKWTDGNLLGSYTSFSSSVTTGECVRMTATGTWETASCSETHDFICEFTPNNVVQNELGVAGSMELGDTSLPTTELMESTSSASSFTLTYFPGWWFSSEGIVRWFTFRAGDLASDTLMKIVIYRPSCVGGKSLSKPGCGQNQFFSCGASTTCITRPTCSSMHTCFLSEQCETLSRSCSCRGSHSSAINCNAAPINSGSTPLYTPVESTTVLVPKAKPSLYQVKVNIGVQPGDFMGVMYEGSTAPVHCAEDLKSKWAQKQYTVSGVGSDTIEIPHSGASLSENQLCHLSAFYSKTDVQTLPDHLASVTNSGTYTFQYKMLGQPVKYSCTIEVMEPVKDIVWVYPSLVDGNIKVDMNTLSTLAAKVTGGTDLVYEWTVSDVSVTSNMTLSEKCPSGVDSSVTECLTSDSTVDKPFTYVQHVFTAPGTVKLNVSNKISYVAKEYNVSLGPCMPIKGLTLCHESCLTSPKVCSSGCEPLIQVGVESFFQVWYSQGSAEGESTFTVNGLVKKSSQNSNNSLIFDADGTQNVEVNRTCDTHSAVASLDVKVEKAAHVQNLKVWLPWGVVVTQPFDVRVTADVEDDAEVNISIDHKDGKTASVYSMITSDGHINWTSTYTYSKEAKYTVTVTISDPFESVASNASTYALASVNVKQVTAVPEYALPNTQIIFSVWTVPAIGTHVIVSDSKLYYNWSLPHKVERVESNAVNSTMKNDISKIGTHNVTLSVRNPASVVYTWVIVHIQVCVDGLQLLYDGPAHIKDNVTFTVQMLEGSDVSYSLDPDDGRERINQTSSRFVLNYSSPGIYNASVVAYNDLKSCPEIRAELTTYVIDDDSLFLVDILPHQCFMSGVPGSLAAVSVNTNPAALDYKWDFGNGTTVSGIGLLNVTVLYAKHGTYDVSISAKNKTFARKLCIQEEIRDLKLTAATPIRLKFGKSVEELLETETTSGSDISYEWKIQNKVQGCDKNNCSFTIHKAATFEISVNASNNVSYNSVSKWIESQYEVATLALACDSCNEDVYISTSKDAELEANAGNATKVTFLYNFGSGYVSDATHKFNSVGMFNVCVSATNLVSAMEKCMDLVSQHEIRSLSLSTNTSGGLGEIEIGQSINFTADIAQGTNVTYEWKCGDGTTKKTQTPAMICNFPISTTVKVSVKASNKVSKKTVKKTIYILEKINSLSINHSLFMGVYGGAGERLNFSAVSNTQLRVSYEWHVRKGNLTQCSTSGEAMTGSCNLISAPGEYSIVLQVSNFLGSLTRILKVIIIERMSNIKIIPSKVDIPVKEIVTFRAGYDTGSNLLFHWSYTRLGGTRKELSSIKETVTHIFQDEGDYSIGVNVTSRLEPEGKHAEKLVFVEVPVVGVEILSNSGNYDFLPKLAKVKFHYVRHAGTGLKSKWTLSGPKTSIELTSNELTHEFLYVGEYTVSVNVSNRISHKMYTKIFRVEEVVSSVEINVKATLITTGEALWFRAVASPGAVYHYNWTSNDHGEHFSSNTFQKVFPIEGVYTIKVIVFNNVSQLSSTKEIVVQDPVTGLDFDECSSKVSGEEVKITAVKQTGTNVTYEWVLHAPDGSSMSKASNELTHDFDFIGLYFIQLTASNRVSSLSKNCTIRSFGRVHISSIKVRADLKYKFVNQTIYFEVEGDYLTHANFTWTFNDSHVNTTTEGKYEHKFEFAGVYSVQVMVSNEVSKDVKTQVFSIHVLDCKLPKVTVATLSPVKTPRSRPVDLAVTVDSSNCQEYRSSHSWKIYSASSCSDSLVNPVPLGATYTNSPTLHLEARTLPTGTYCAVFNTAYVDTFVKVVANLTLIVTSSDLIAVIDGGSERTFSNDHSVEMSCLNSQDPDDLSTQLACFWTCQPSVSCPWTTETAASFVRTFQPGSYSVRLTVTEGSTGRSAAAIQKIIVVSTLIPSISIECVSCKSSTFYKINAGQHVALASRCANCDDRSVLYEWTVKTNGRGVNLTSSTTTGMNGRNLVIKEGVLKEASSFEFQLEAKFQGHSGIGSSMLELQGNKAPSGGACSVTPKTILNLETAVKVECSGWTDADPDALLYYHVLVKGVSSSGEVVAYPAYYGSSSNINLYLASLPGTDRTNVSLDVYISDNYGAYSIKHLGEIQLMTPPLGPSTTKTDYIFSKAQTMLPLLLKQNNPSMLLLYAIALCQEMNQESDVMPQIVSKEKRATIRDAITVCLMAIPVNTLQNVQQMAYLLQLLTKYFDEYQTDSCHLVIVESLKNITSVLQRYATQGRNQEHFVPRHLLATISNLIEAVNLEVYNPGAVTGWEAYPIQVFYKNFTNLRPEISAAMDQVMHSHGVAITEQDVQHRQIVVPSAFEIAEQIMTTILMTTMSTEKSDVIRLGGIEVHGQRSRVTDIWQKRQLEGCLFEIPSNLFEGIMGNDEEVLQISFVVSKNPFTWGYIKNLTINSWVPSLSLKDSRGQPIPISNLPKSKNFKIFMFENAVESNQTQILKNSSLIQSEYYNPLERLHYTTATVQRTKAKQVDLDVSQGADSASGLHIQVRIFVLPNATEEASGVIPSGSVTAYLGINFVASKKTFSDVKVISTEDMAVGVDHRNYTFFQGTKSFKSNFQYSLSIYNDDVYHDVNVSVAAYFSSCQYFNTEKKDWDSSGCVVLEESISTCSVCECNHLTSFGSSMLAPPNVIDIKDLANLDLFTNPVVMIAIGIILFVYIVLVLIFYKLDRLDLKRICMIPLCGKDGGFKYEITVVTGRKLTAGTTAHVGIKLYGCDNKGQARHLTKVGAFQRNCSDKFIVASDKNLGPLKKILIWHDNAGMSPSWFLNHVVVKDLEHDRKYYFLANLWLSVEQNPPVLRKEIPAASKNELQTKSFQTATSHGFAERHLWMSLMDRPDHSRFTRVQRATCCVTVLLFFMMVNAMWYGVIKTGADASKDFSDYTFSWEEIVIGLVSNIIILPVAALLILLFKKSRSKGDTFEDVQKPQSAQTLEIPIDGLFHGSSVRIPHGDWGSFYTDRASTSDNIPIAPPLKRTYPMMSRTRTLSHDGSIQEENEQYKSIGNGKSSVESIRRTSMLMWNHQGVMNWPEKACSEDTKSIMSSSTVSDRRMSSATTSTITSRGKHKSNKVEPMDSDDEFEQTLNELEKDNDKYIARRKGVAGKKGKGSAKSKDTDEGLFSSDDEWVSEGLDQVKESKAQAKKSITKTPARAGGATALTRFNPRDDAKLQDTRQSSLDDSLFPEDTQEKTGKPARKSLVLKGQRGGRQPLSKEEITDKDVAERKTSTSSILKKHDSQTYSTNTSVKETSFMKQPSFTAFSEKSKSTMSACWMRNYYSSTHHIKETQAGCMLPSWCVYVAYVLCAALSVISIIIVLLYGYNFGPEISLKWLLSLFLSFCCSALIIEPIKVLIIAMFLAATSRDVHEDIENESINILPSVEFNETIKEVQFHPLGGYALLHAQEEGQKITRMHIMVRQFISHMFLLTLLLAISFVHYSTNSFIFSRHLGHQLQQSDTAGTNLSNIRSILDFNAWSQSVLAETLHRRELFPLEQSGILLGPARLRQLRSLYDPCPISSDLVKFSLPSLTALPCDGIGEDTQDYGEGWNNISLGANASWRYFTAQQLHMRSKFGASKMYPGGGYVMNLGSTYNETLSILDDLENKEWIDLRTRAVFIEWTVYSVELDLTSVVSVLIEFPLSSGVLTSSVVSTQKLLRFTSGRVDPLMVCEVLLSLCVVYLCVHLGLTVHKQRGEFFRQFWNWLDIIFISMAIACISLYIACVVTATDTFTHYTTHKNDFTNFERTSHLHDIMRYLHAWLLFLFFLKIVHQLRFFKAFHVYGKTVHSMLGKLCGCTLIFLLLLFTYAQLGYLYFGMMTQGFSSFQSSLLTLFGVIRGTFDFWIFLSQWPVMTHFYFYSFYAFTYGLFIALVIAVMNDTYKMSVQTMYYRATLDTQDYEMVEFIMKRFKLWMGVAKQKPAFRKVKFKGLPSLPSRDSTTMSGTSRRSSLSSSSTSSSTEPVLTEEAALYLEHQLDNAVPQWESVLNKFTRIERLEREEDRQFKQLEKEFNEWETKKNSPEHKPSSSNVSSFEKFQLNFKGKSQMVNKQKGLIGRTSATPPEDSPRKPAPESDERRPLSDQSKRLEGPELKKRDSTKNVRFSKQAW